jgi:hypothetical protein
MCIPISRQRLGKRIPATHVHATIGLILLSNGLCNRGSRVFYVVSTTHSDTWYVFSVVPCRVYIREPVWRNTSIKKMGIQQHTTEYTTVVKSSLGIGKKRIRRWQEDFTCDLKLQWDCDKSVARIPLVETENHNVCVTVNWKCVE